MEILKAPPEKRPNYLVIPVTASPFNEEGVALMNKLIKKYKALPRIKRSPSGGISLETRFPAMDVRRTHSRVELTVIDKDGMFRFQLQNGEEADRPHMVSGAQSFRLFKELCADYFIDLDDYAIENGEEVKRDIEKYLVKLERPKVRDHVFKGLAHHIDLHSAFASALVRTHPEFKDVVQHLYDGRREHPEYKDVLNMSIGYMQSIPCCHAKWANLSRDAINNNNEKLRTLAECLRRSGRIVIAYNTDGIWYYGKPYHAKGEGNGLGQWSNDHLYCDIRFKSEGAYEYIEDGEYHPVLRGRTALDYVKPRSQWQWGDIYNKDATPIKYEYDEDEMIVKEIK